MESVNKRFTDESVTYYRDTDGKPQTVTADKDSSGGVPEGWTREEPMRFSDDEGTVYRVPAWEAGNFAKGNVAEGRTVHPMYRMRFGVPNVGDSLTGKVGSKDVWVSDSGFYAGKAQELAKRGWKRVDDAGSERSVMETAFSPDTYAQAMSDPDYLKNIPENVGRGLLAAYGSAAVGVARTASGLVLKPTALALGAVGADGAADAVRGAAMKVDKIADDALGFITDGVLGENFSNEGDGTREAVKGTLDAAAEVGGLYGLGTVMKVGGKVVGGATGAVLKASGAAEKTVQTGVTAANTGVMTALMGAEAAENQIEGAVQKIEAGANVEEGRQTVAAAINTAIATATAPLYGRLTGIIGKSDAGRVIRETYDKMLANAMIDVVEGAGLGAVQAAVGELSNAVLGEKTDGWAKRIMTSAVAGGGIVLATKIPAALMPKLSGWVGRERVRYAAAAVRQGRAAAAVNAVGEPIVKSRSVLPDVKAATVNGDIVFEDGSVYKPATQDRVVDMGNGRTMTVSGRGERIVLADKTVLDANGKVVDVLAGRMGTMPNENGLYEDYGATTVAGRVAEVTDPETGSLRLRIVDPNTGEVVDSEAIAWLKAPESVTNWMKTLGTKLADGTPVHLPELDAEGNAYMTLRTQVMSGLPDVSRSAQLALERVASGDLTYGEAAKLVDNAIESTLCHDRLYGRKATAADADGKGVEESARNVNAAEPAQGVVARPDRKGGVASVDVVNSSEAVWQYANDGTMAPETVDVGKMTVAAGAAANGPVIVRRGRDGSLEVVSGTASYEAGLAKGEKTVEAVVVSEENGWDPARARTISYQATVHDPNASAVDLMRAVGGLGLTGDQAGRLGIHVRNAWRAVRFMSAETLGRLSPENADVLAALAKGMNAKSHGVGWEELQNRLAESLPQGADATTARLVGEIAHQMPEAEVGRIWEIAQWMSANGERLSSEGVSLKAFDAKAVERMMAEDAAGTVPVEGKDGNLKTVNQAESEAPKPTSEDVAATEPAVDRSVDIVPVTGKDGVFQMAALPNVQIRTVVDETGTKVFMVEGCELSEMLDPRNRSDYGKAFAALADRAAKEGAQVDFGEGNENVALAAKELLKNYRIEGRENALLERGSAVVSVLTESGLAAEVLESDEAFDAALRSSTNAREFRASDGTIYGFEKDGRIYLNQRWFGTMVGLSTKIHEFGHLGIQACRKINPALYKRGLELAWKLANQEKLENGEANPYRELLADEFYSKLDRQDFCEEILAKLIGDRGAAALKGTTKDGVFAEIRQWLGEFWKAYGQALGLADITEEQIDNMTVGEIADAIRAEMMSGSKFGEMRLPEVKADVAGTVKASKVTLSGGTTLALVTDLESAAKISHKDPRSIKEYVLRNMEDGIQMLVGGTADVNAKTANHLGWSLVRGLGTRGMRRARAKAATVIKDLIGMFTADSSSYENKIGKNGVAWRNRLPIGVPVLDYKGKVVGGIVYDADVVIKDDGHGKFFYDISHLKKNGTLTQQLDGQAAALVGAERTAIAAKAVGSASGAPSPKIVPNAGSAVNGAVKPNRGGNGGDDSLFIARRARVADDAGRGENVAGSIEASNELAYQVPTPIQNVGRSIRRLSLPISELEFLRKQLTGNNVPAHVSDRIPGGRNAAHTKSGKLVIAADVFGMVDKTDMKAEKDNLLLHGFFMNEDPTWCLHHSNYEIRAERKRSDDQLARQLLALADRRAKGQSAGGESTARGIFADELAKIVMDLPQVPAGGTVGRVRTIGEAIRNEIKNRIHAVRGTNADAERIMLEQGGDFLDYAYGQRPDPATGNPTNRRDTMTVKEMTSDIFGAFMVMPYELGARAPRWHDAIVDIIAGTPKLEKAWKDLTAHAADDHSFGYVVDQIAKAQSRQTEIAIAALNASLNEPISPEKITTRAWEGIVTTFDDRFGIVNIRIDEKAKLYLKARREALKAANTPADKAAIQAEIDRFTGDIAKLKKTMELSRTAHERGSMNEGRRYYLKMLLLENEARGRWGLSENDRSAYLNLRRIVETQGKAGAFGISPRQAQLALDAMKNRLGPEKWTRMQEYGHRFHATVEQEILNDPRVEQMFGKDWVNYCLTQVDYVTTKRQFSPEELYNIETQRAAMRRLGVNGGDDIVSEMFNYAGRIGAGGGVPGEDVFLKRLKGSFAANQEVRSATWEKHDKLMQAVRRNAFVISIRDALLAAGVEGVSDHRRGNVEFKDGKRYGHLNYMLDGQKRTLVVPRQIADAMRWEADRVKWISTVNNLCRKCFIDWNIPYWMRNVNRNVGSIEKNMPGMHENWLKTVLRGTLPGAAQVGDVTLQHVIRHMDEHALQSKAIRGLFGKNTVIWWIPKATRVARVITDPTGWQKDFWAAGDARDRAKVQEMMDDLATAMEVLRGNMFVGGAQGLVGDRTEGFANDVIRSKGWKTLDKIREDAANDPAMKKMVDKINIFAKNAEQQNYEDVLAKCVAYLHDRWRYGLQRTPQESGLMVKQNVSIGEGERSGYAKTTIQKLINPFWNMIEKGVTRHARNLFTRKGQRAETWGKDALVWSGRVMSGMVTSGLIGYWIRKLYDGDEKKIQESKMAGVYNYARFAENAQKNLSEYVRKNYMTTPLWTSANGYTSIVLGLPLNDEDKLITPTADLAIELMAHQAGIGRRPEVAKAVSAATIGGITPDFQMAAPIVNLFQDTVGAMLIGNPQDHFRGAPKYDESLYNLRGESWEMAGKFSWAVGCQVWNDMGGRMILETPRNGVDNGDGAAPELIATALRKIPVASPVLRSMIKIQVGSPSKDGQPITDEEKRERDLIKVLSLDLIKRSQKAGRPYDEADPAGYEKQIGKWRETYKLSDLSVQKIEAKYLNAMNAKENGDSEIERQKRSLYRKAMKQEFDEAEYLLERGEW